MSDFPKGGDIQKEEISARNKLDKKGFTGKLVGWDADEILGKSDGSNKSKSADNTPEEQEIAERLCNRLKIGRQTAVQQGKILFFGSISKYDRPKIGTKND